MNFSVNPLSFASMPIDTPQAQATFLGQLSTLLNQMVTSLNGASALASTLNGNSTLTLASLATAISDLGTITTNKTVDCKGSGIVFVRLTSASNQTRTLTLSNLPQGAYVMISVDVTATFTLTFNVAATDTASNAYTVTSFNTNTGLAADLGLGVLLAGGTGLAGEWVFFGMSGFIGTSATPRLNLLYI